MTPTRSTGQAREAQAAVQRASPGAYAQKDVEGWKIIRRDGYPLTEATRTRALAWALARKQMS